MKRVEKIFFVLLLLLPLVSLLVGAFLMDYPAHKQFAHTLKTVGELGLLLEFLILLAQSN